MIDHADMVRRLTKPGSAILETMTADRMNLLHMAVGLSGEAAELLAASDVDYPNMLEELGDCEFYIEGLRQAVGVEPVATGRMVHPKVRVPLAIAAGEVLDQVKKHVIYNKPLDMDALRAALYALEQGMVAARNFARVTRDQCLAANVEKLGVRYQGLVYSDQAAQHRADKL